MSPHPMKSFCEDEMMELWTITLDDGRKAYRYRRKVPATALPRQKWFSSENSVKSWFNHNYLWSPASHRVLPNNKVGLMETIGVPPKMGRDPQTLSSWFSSLFLDGLRHGTSLDHVFDRSQLVFISSTVGNT